ncbi:unnamed protein product [Allacma fusca]|uniref:Uncharacterized protein n=1 Tax=Allacma fusca TaxID=39272 RepID=A0A8J2NS45_9HEXA|nr:unnamed protein product [Allacma fusca]
MNLFIKFCMEATNLIRRTLRLSKQGLKKTTTKRYQSSRAAKERKKRRIASTGMVKSQEDTNTLLSKMVENMSQLVKVASQPSMTGWQHSPYIGYHATHFSQSPVPSSSTSGSYNGSSPNSPSM